MATLPGASPLPVRIHTVTVYNVPHREGFQVLPVYLTYTTLTSMTLLYKGWLDACGKQMIFARVSIMSWYYSFVPSDPETRISEMP